MLTSFFSKSKPINFIVVSIYMVFFYYIALFSGFFEFSFNDFLEETGILLLFLFSMLVLNFIAKRNELTERNAYKTILFAAFACMLPDLLQNNAVIIANVFVLLALRRIISLKSQRATRQKIFDATFWICIASLFYFWTILFLLLVFLGILLHVNQNYKNWLIPIVALLTVLSLTSSIHLLITDGFYTFWDWFQAGSINFTAYQQIAIIVPVAFLLALALWSSFFYMGTIKNTSSNLKASLIIVFFAAMLALTVAVLAPIKNSSELLFFLGPLAIIVTNYFQVLEDKWFKEILLAVIILLPVFNLFFF